MGMNVDLGNLIDLIYEAAVDVQAWAPAMVAIADALGAQTTSLTIADPDRNVAPFLVAPRTEPEWLREYSKRWSSSNLVRERGLAFPAGQPYRFEDLMPRSEFERTPFYNEFWAPQRQNLAIFVNVAKTAGAVAGIGFYRSLSAGQFEADNERLLSALAPHLQRAVALNLRLGRLEMERDGTAEMLNNCEHGALLVDAEARVLFANKPAETILREGTGLRISDGRLAAGVPAKTAALRAMIADGSKGIPGDKTVMSSFYGRNLTVEVFPLRAETSWLLQQPAAIVFVKDSQATALPTRNEIRLWYDLTPAQAALASEILKGDGIEAAAARLGIARSTARTHLLELFRKTGTSRQAELVRVILQYGLRTHDRPDRVLTRSRVIRSNLA